MDRTEPTAPVMHVWASSPAPDDPPDRLAVSVCPACSALVADEALHTAHHEAEVTR